MAVWEKLGEEMEESKRGFMVSREAVRKRGHENIRDRGMLRL